MRRNRTGSAMMTNGSHRCNPTNTRRVQANVLTLTSLIEDTAAGPAFAGPGGWITFIDGDDHDSPVDRAARRRPGRGRGAPGPRRRRR